MKSAVITLDFLRLTLVFFKLETFHKIAKKCLCGPKMTFLRRLICLIISHQMLSCFGHHMPQAEFCSMETSLKSFYTRTILSYT